MKLLDYLQSRGETVTEFARRAAIEVSTVHRAAHGKTVPTPLVAKKIAEATDNAVTPNDFYGIEAA